MNTNLAVSSEYFDPCILTDDEFAIKATKLWLDKLQMHARYFDTTHNGKIGKDQRRVIRNMARRIIYNKKELRYICELINLDYQRTVNMLQRAMEHPELISYNRGSLEDNADSSCFSD